MSQRLDETALWNSKACAGYVPQHDEEGRALKDRADRPVTSSLARWGFERYVLKPAVRGRLARRLGNALSTETASVEGSETPRPTARRARHLPLSAQALGATP